MEGEVGEVVGLGVETRVVQNNFITQTQMIHFPQIPAHKRYNSFSQMTPEQEAMMNAIKNHNNLSKKDEKILRECRDFYLHAIKFLKKIELSKITKKDALDIISYLNTIFNYIGVIRNEIYFKYSYRITQVKDSFLEDGKVRNENFISYPPQDVIEKLGFYGRANSPKSTVFYCSFSPNIALLEIKPKVGDRIIITEWYKEKSEPFISYPILNKNITINEGLVKASGSFEQTMSAYPFYLKRLYNLYFDFIGDEFVKDKPIESAKRFEYLFSSYFSDKVLNGEIINVNNGDVFQYDCIIYPSVSAKHQTDNLAVHPKSVHKLQPILMEDCIVRETSYETFDLASRKSVIGRQVLRQSTQIDKGRIVWSDD